MRKESMKKVKKVGKVNEKARERKEEKQEEMEEKGKGSKMMHKLKPAVVIAIVNKPKNKKR